MPLLTHANPPETYHIVKFKGIYKSTEVDYTINNINYYRWEKTDYPMKAEDRVVFKNSDIYTPLGKFFSTGESVSSAEGDVFKSRYLYAGSVLIKERERQTYSIQEIRIRKRHQEPYYKKKVLVTIFIDFKIKDRTELFRAKYETLIDDGQEETLEKDISWLKRHGYDKVNTSFTSLR